MSINERALLTSVPGPSIKWPGAKWSIVSWILENMPVHDCYVEGFFGSGALFFNKTPSNVEIINDRDGAIVNLFRLIRDKPEELATLIALTPWSREEYDTCRKALAKGDEMEQARRFMVSMWQAIGMRRASYDEVNVAGSSGWRSRDASDQSPVATWRRMPERIRVASSRLLDAQIENRPALDVFTRYRDQDALIYADPPYHPSTRKRRMYAHEMSEADHLEMIKVLRDHPGPVLLSGYRCAVYDEALRDWHREETNTRDQKLAVRREVLWMNKEAVRRLEMQRQQLGLFQ